MAVITQDEIRQLAAFQGVDAPVTSCYVEVDGRRHPRYAEVVHRVERMIHGARGRAESPSVQADLVRIDDHVRRGFDRSRVRGVAIFSCSARDLWRVVELPVAVRDQLVVNHSPYVRQLEWALDEGERFGVLLADRQRARMFVFELGELVESTELFEQLPRHDDDDQSYLKDKGQDHLAALTHQHLRHAAGVAFEVFQREGFERLVVGAPDEIAPELESHLHPYLKERLEARISVPVAAPLEVIRLAALEIEAGVERRREDEAVRRLRAGIGGAGRRGVAGLDATLQALNQRRVELLLVSNDFAEPGWRCPACQHVGRVGRACPVCDAAMDRVDDVVEEAVEEALAQSCEVELCAGNADLDVLGRIGALLRY